MQFPWRLLRKKRPAPDLGLDDPAHPARKWIDAATVIADRRLDVKLVNGRHMIETSPGGLGDLVGALDLALQEASDDADLLCVRAAARYLLQDKTRGDDDVKCALRAEPSHVEACLMRKHGDKWQSLLSLPSWSQQSRQIHPVLAEEANQGESLHCPASATICAFAVAPRSSGPVPGRGAFLPLGGGLQ
jgi:hypothetical protein